MPGFVVEGGVLHNEQVNATAAVVGQNRFCIAMFTGKLLRLAELLALIHDDMPGPPPHEAYPDGVEARAEAEWGLLIGQTLRHEAGHIANGHVEYGMSKALTTLDRQLLEADADSYAARVLACGFTGIQQSDVGTEFRIPEGMPLDVVAYRTELLGAVLYTNFRVAEELAPSPFPVTGEITPSFHPPPIVRIWLLGSLLATMFASFDEPVRNHLISAFLKGALLREKALAYKQERPFDVQLPRATSSVGVWRYGATLINHWNTVRPELMPFKRTPGQLAAAQDYPMDPPPGWTHP
ncbi:hypothetical protein [Mesorhizobium sp. KR9-304]|uniref:hypothetical protein n=1 Tax=Mesorhizobium sp. KR9-304 TaxID=3156614 RepID=UPI0032B36168